MNNDKFGMQILTETDICDAYMRNPDLILKNALVDTDITFDSQLELENIPHVIKYIESVQSVDEFDKTLQNNWYMPEEYKTMDIAKYVLDLCQEDYEFQRVGEELLKFQERNLFPLLRYCKYLVDKMRQHSVVWGVGRGSSVSSYVLFLIGIHRINSLHYDLSIDEFLK
jgi:hypothetical protein